MELLNLPRQAGKTTKVVDAMKKNPDALMITFCEMEKQRIMRENPSLKGRVMTLTDYQKQEFRGRRFSEVHIDNLEMCLRIGHRIGLMTMTNYPQK